MGIEDLTSVEIYYGIVGLLAGIFATFVGTVIASKYAKYKRPELLFVGLSLIFLVISYLAMGIQFLLFIFFDFIINDTLYIFFFVGFPALSNLCFITAMAILLWPYSKKKIILIWTIINMSYEAYIIACLLIKPSLLAIRTSLVETELTTSIVWSLFALFFIFSALITMSIFVKGLLKSDNPRTIWKGRFLLASMLFLVIGVLIGIIAPDNFTLNIIARILFATRAFLSYLGWLLPHRVAKFLIKDYEKT